MALVLADRVKETTTTTGTGTITLAGASIGFQSFAVIGNANTTYYAIVDSGAGAWEVGIGTYTSSGTTLSRDTVLSNSLGTTAFVNFAAGTKDVFVTYPAAESVYYQDTGGVVITEAGTANALRVTNTGTGNSFVVEDSASPDASPFVVDASGFIVSGTTAPVNVGGSQSTRFQIHTAGGSPNSGIGLVNWNSVGAQTAIVYLSKSLGGAINTRGIVTNGTILSRISSTGDDGATFLEAARIDVVVDGTPGTNDMPARLVFSTTADGASSPTERMRIDSAGFVGIGNAAPTVRLDVVGSTTISSQVNVSGRFGVGVTSDLLLGSLNGNSPFVASQGANPLLFFTNATEQARITSAGFVGIGITAPTCALDVLGGIKTSRTTVTSPAATDGNIFSGTYTPSLTNTTNIASSTAAVCQYMRVGNVVTVSGTVTIDPTATGRIVMGFSLPIASAITAATQCGGTYASSGTSTVNAGSVTGDATNDRATFDGVSNDVASRVYGFSFTYQVL